MEREKTEQTLIPFRCKKADHSINEKMEKSHSEGKQSKEDDGVLDSTSIIESPTPQKLEVRSRIRDLGSPLRKQLHERFDSESNNPISQSSTNETGKSLFHGSSIAECTQTNLNVVRGAEIVKLPDKFEALACLFNCMDRSIRLLNLRKKLPTLQNICKQVQVLTKKELLHSHVSQMKFVFPEAISVKRILLHDDISLCMMPHITVSVNLEAIASTLRPGQSAHMALCQEFHERLLEFLKSNPQVDGIPEAVLPETYFEKNQEEFLCILSMEPSLETSQEIAHDHESTPCISHLPVSFKKKFSEKMFSDAQSSDYGASPSVAFLDTVVDNSDLNEAPDRIESTSLKLPKQSFLSCLSTDAPLPESTPTRHVLNSGVLKTETPSLQTPERPKPTPNDKSVSDDDGASTVHCSATKLALSARRALVYSPSKDDDGTRTINCCPKQTDVLKGKSVLGGNRMSAKFQLGSALNNTTTAAGVHVWCDAQRSRQENIACLPNTFDVICNISRSINCSYITKEELCHKIISNNFDIEDTSEVDDQLSLLEELVPDWIYKKAVSSGDTLYSFKPRADLASVRARLVEAI